MQIAKPLNVVSDFVNVNSKSVDFLVSFFQVTENTELEFFETSAQSGKGVTEVRRIRSFSKSLPLVTHTTISFREDLHLYSLVDANCSYHSRVTISLKLFLN